MKCVFIIIINNCVFVNENFLYLLSFGESKGKKYIHAAQPYSRQLNSCLTLRNLRVLLSGAEAAWQSHLETVTGTDTE